MRINGLNRWPDRNERREYYTHNLSQLLRLAQIDIFQLDPDPIRAKLGVVLLWQRGEGYNPTSMPTNVARDMCESALGEEGVNRWIESRFRLVR